MECWVVDFHLYIVSCGKSEGSWSTELKSKSTTSGVGVAQLCPLVQGSRHNTFDSEDLEYSMHVLVTV